VNGDSIELEIDYVEKFEPVSIRIIIFIWHGKQLQEMKDSIIHEDLKTVASLKSYALEDIYVFIYCCIQMRYMKKQLPQYLLMTIQRLQTMHYYVEHDKQ